MTRQGILPSMPPRYKVRRLRLHSQHQVIVVMRADCDVCRSEGLAIRSQVLVTHGERHIHAILFQVEWGRPCLLSMKSASRKRLGACWA